MPVIAKAKGKHVYDIDGKKYLDFTGANLTTVLGYRPTLPSVPNYPGVSDTEQELTDMLSGYTGTKHWRYFKNGHNAVDCAVRLARRILRNPNANVIYMGYHGTSDSYISTTKDNNGIPLQHSEQIKTASELTEGYKYDILVFESRYAECADKIDANIKICDTLKDGIRALYDGVDYGVSKSPPFIIDNYYNKAINNYDFTLMGKSIANGSPLAVMTGKDELMEQIDDIYYSTTFGCNPGDMRECIRTIKDFEKVKDKYFKLYKYAKEVLPAWQSITPADMLKFQEHGILYNGYWSIHIQHTKKDIDTLKKYC